MGSKIEAWVLDLRVFFHATLSKELLNNYIMCNLGNVYLGDNLLYDVVGKRLSKDQIALIGMDAG